MRTEVLTSISQIDSGLWNSIVSRNHLICRHEYLLAIERSNINDCRFFYPVTRDGNELVAHACVYFISTQLDTFLKGPLKWAISGIRGIWPSFLVMRTLECGTPVALGSTISVRAEMKQEQAIASIVTAVEQKANELGVGVVLFRDFTEEDLSNYAGLVRAGYKIVHNLPTARMDVKWSTFDAYVSDLRSEYRNKMRARIRKFVRDGGIIETLGDFSQHAALLAGLWKNVYDRAKEYKREVLNEGFFHSMDTHLGSRSAVLLARLGGMTTAFMLLLFDDDTLVPLFCGLDYQYSRHSGVYFNLFYAVIRTAIEHRLNQIDFGITSLVPKLEIGAVPVRLHVFMKHLTPAINAFLPGLFRLMTPQKIPCVPKVYRAL